jgi:histidinol phosphatase-like enzyme (inositol monophosphatase family)
MTTPSGTELAGDLRPFLRHLTGLTGPLALEWFNRPDLVVERKADRSVVTEVDRRIEEVLRREIGREFPAHGILGEEHADTGVDAEYTWVVDPIDGTQSYVSACPLFGTLIALRRGTEALWGAIHLPALGLLYLGDNVHAWCGERPLRVRETPLLEDCLLLTTEFTSPAKHQSGAGWEALVSAVGLTRGWGDCYGYTLVANGTADIMGDPIMNLWDIAALLPVLRGAGAAVSDWRGGAPETATSLLAAHPRHHARLVALLNPPA